MRDICTIIISKTPVKCEICCEGACQRKMWPCNQGNEKFCVHRGAATPDHVGIKKNKVICVVAMMFL